MNRWRESEMEIEIYRASDGYGESAVTPPTEKAYKKNNKDGSYNWYIKINTLEELMELVKKEYSIIIYEDMMVIYDDYIE